MSAPSAHDSTSSSPARRSSWWLFVCGLAPVLALLAVDLVTRRATLAAFTPLELRQYLLSLPGSFALWAGVAALLGVPLARRALDAARTLGLAALAFALLFSPAALYLTYRRLPNEAAIRFFANEWRFTLKSAGNMFNPEALVVVGGLVAGLAAFTWLSRRRAPTRRGLALGLVLLTSSVGSVALSRLSPSLPMTADLVGVRFASLLVRWHGDPPPFFEVVQRSPLPLDPPPPALPFDVLWVVHETLGAQYLQTPDGRAVTPELLALKADPAVVWLEQLHTQSSCTDVSVPSQLSGVSTAASLFVQQQAALPFDVARAAGAATFVTSAQRMSWAHLDAYLGASAMSRFVSAEDFDAHSDDDVGVPDEQAYAAALTAMDEAHARGQRFMGMVKTNTTHGPYQVDPQDQPWTDAAGFGLPEGTGFVRYLNSLHYGDRQFGAFWRALAQRPWFDEVLVVVTADHGEAFGQHGLLAHCGSFYPEESHVPGALRLPRTLREDPARAATVAQVRAAAKAFVGTVDLFPTVADALGWSPGLTAQFGGHSWFAPLPPERRYVFTNCSDARGCPVADLGFEQGGLRWVYSSVQRRWQAFEEQADPHATHDVAQAHAAELGAALEALLHSPREGGVVQRLLGPAGGR